MLKASIIISFYNNIDALLLILKALDYQTVKDFEVIIADDGSKESVVAQVKAEIQNHTYKINHVWHEDDGFRKTRILNKAILASESEYLIFIDGDCIPHRKFISDHLHFKNENRIVAGRRVNLTAKLSEKIKQGQVRYNTPLFTARLLCLGLFNRNIKAKKAIYINIPPLNYFIKQSNRGILGCNFSLYKSAMERINGFDLQYVNPYVGEDTDIDFRLRKMGYKVYLPKCRLVLYHLHHKRMDRISEKINEKIFQRTKLHNEIIAKSGLAQTIK